MGQRQVGAGGKPSTWLPPGRLLEHNQHPHGDVTNHEFAQTNIMTMQLELIQSKLAQNNAPSQARIYPTPNNTNTHTHGPPLRPDYGARIAVGADGIAARPT